jgi:hypothetical protein
MAARDSKLRRERRCIHRAAEQCNDPVFRDMLKSLALQWRLAAREEAAKHATQPKNLTRFVSSEPGANLGSVEGLRFAETPA